MVRASGNDARFFEAEIAVLARHVGTDNDVIDQVNLENFAGFENSAGKAQICFGGRWIAGWMVVLCGLDTYVMGYACPAGRVSSGLV
jgi:hypothetical protein